MIAPCGMNCGLCQAFIRDKNVCPGCRGSDDLKAKSTLACHIKNCRLIKTQKAKYCFECGEYPCDRLDHLDHRYRTKYSMSMIENLGYIRQFGIRRFVAQEKERWACPQCDKKRCVHKANCIHCGHTWR